VDPGVRCARAATATVLVLTAVGCGVEAEDSARQLDRESVPFDLLEPEVRDAPVLEEGNQFVIYLVDEETLFAVTRAVEARPTVDRALRALVRGPTGDEAAAGIGTAIPPGSEIRSVVVDGDTATFDLGGRFEENVRGQEARALAQVVYTSTGLEGGVTRIRFRLEGERIVVPRGDGTQTSRPVSRNDYPGPGA
jgi:Sporulation and spore germination